MRKKTVFFLVLFFVFFGVQSKAAQECHMITDTTSDIPKIFAVPWSVFTKTIFLTANCDKDTVTVQVGNGKENQYIWHKLYYTDDAKNGWKPPISLAGKKMVANGKWIMGKASGNFSLTAQKGNVNYMAAYICEWQKDAWKCGCRDADTCTEMGLWSLQAFSISQKNTPPAEKNLREKEEKNKNDSEETGELEKKKKEEKRDNQKEKTVPQCVPQKQAGKVTYYNRPDTEPVSCSYDIDNIPVLHGAMNAEQYNNAAVCGACVRVTGPKGSVDIEIINLCPECKKGHIDLSPAAFEKIAELEKGSVPVEWEYVPCNKKGPVEIFFREGSTQYWTQIQIRNSVHPIKSVEYKTKGSDEYISLPRVSYNYFSAEKGMGEGPFTFRITDIYGQVIEKENVSLHAGEGVSTEKSFPMCQMSEEKTRDTLQQKQEEKNTKKEVLKKNDILIDSGAYGASSFVPEKVKTGDNIFYVAPNGNDANAGTKENPWKTIGHAAKMLTAGQTAYIRGGTYPLSQQVVIQSSGTKDAWITFAGYPGEVPILEADAYNLGSPGFSRDKGALNIDNGAQYVRVEGLTVKNSHGAGISACNASNIVIIGNTTNMTFSSGINVPSPTNNGCNGKNIKILRNTVVNATRMKMKTATYTGSEAPHEAISIMGADGFEVAYNYIFNSEKEGIDIKEESRHGKVHHNLVENIDRQCYYVDAGFAELIDIEFFNNIGRNCGFMGFAISSELGTTLSDIRFHHNLLYNNGGNGIYFSRFGDDGPRANIKIYNNTLHNNGHGKDAGWIGGGISLYSANMKDVDIYDNIVSNSGDFQLGFAIDQYGSEKGIGERNITVRNNLIFGPQKSAHKWESAMEPFDGKDTIVADPLFTNAAEGDFTLTDNSPAKGAATNGKNIGAL